MKKLIFGLVLVLLLAGCSQTNVAPDAVYTFNGETVTADEYYEKLVDLYGVSYMYQILENLVVGDLVLTDEEKKNAQTQFDSIMDYYSDEESKAYLDAIVRSAGYTGGIDDLLLYIENGIRKQNHIASYIDANFNDEAFLEKLNPRQVKHVLVLFDSDGAFTTATQQKIEEIDRIFATGDPAEMETLLADLIDGKTVVFENLGYTDVNTSFEAPFLQAALALNKGQLSGWVQTTYGYHRIYAYGDSFEDFKGDAGYQDAVKTFDSSIENRAMWSLLQEKVEFTDAFEAQIKAHLEIED
ncbi:hypothetical protein AOC36_01060 [Erysipelothrix larvae]|uniref:PpiC domain-containing protein n=1 Tax=Erysipelothrix larvae TaxID=1514105 RepID=A0A0X8GY96_9FIRM|nr:lipoprotein [Erysipelothrix larvae]AMC92631.1 hypothetical protein AOC36_01060 [Erysipelothrix larvae]